MPKATPDPSPALPAAVERWPVIKVPVPPEWKRWLEEAAGARAIPVAALVRLCIRDLMIRRHEAPASGGE